MPSGRIQTNMPRTRRGRLEVLRRPRVLARDPQGRLQGPREGLAGGAGHALHADRDYRVFFLGFLPGFAYCGTLDPRIAAPRLARPREHVPAGAVAIADGQTGVYPFDSPGGWRLIGRTELAMFDPSHAPAALVRAGDRVRFVRR